MWDRGEVVEGLETTTEEVFIVEECVLPADCDECRSLFQEQSSVITGPSFILDSPANMAVPQRAFLTLPHGLMIGRSSIPDTGLGVMNQGGPGMHFGPYEGEVTSREDAVASRFSWEIYKVSDGYHYIDAARDTHSNWMRYVNCSTPYTGPAGPAGPQNQDHPPGEGSPSAIPNPLDSSMALDVASQEPPGTEEATVAEHAPGQESRPLEDAEGTATREKLHACVQCDKSFSSVPKLKSHHARIHTNLRAYVCALCRKTFLQSSDLARHLRVQQEKEPARAALAEEDEESSEASTDDTRRQDTEGLEPSVPQIPEPPEEPAYRRPQCLRVRSKISAITKLIAPKRSTPVNKRKYPSLGGIVPETRAVSDVGVSTREGRARTPADECTYSCAHCKQKHDSHEALKEHACATAQHQGSRCGSAFKGPKPHMCDACGRAFRQRSHLKRHQKIKNCGKQYHMSEIFSCAYCPFSFTFGSYLRKHLHKHHPLELMALCESERLADGPEGGGGNDEEAGEGAHVCPKCGTKYSTAKKCRHTCTYPCTDCGKGFSNRYNLKQHQRGHAGERPHGCPHCPKTFLHMSKLTVHLRIHTGEKPYGCPHCPKTFLHRSRLSVHLRSHTGERPHGCPHCPKTFMQKSQLTVHLCSHTGERPHSCPHCPKTFLHMSKLTVHLRSHTGERPYGCPHCPKTFVQKSKLTVHLRSHTGERPQSCPHCPKTFVQKSKLTVHLRSHTGERPYGCPHCPKTFLQKSQLTVHLRSHTGERPYLCAHCGQRFRQSVHLKRHQQAHAGERPYLCAHCGQRFRQAVHLKRHQQTHTGERPYLCAHCGQRFRQSVHLMRHQQTHAGVRSYSCPECSRSFSRPQNLRAHLLRHRRTLACDTCGKSFSRNDRLRRHQQKMHP